MLIKYIDKIHTFLLVYESKSFSKASKILGISQPAVTQQIKQLEDFLETSLVERKKNGILLTREGKYFLDIAMELQKTVTKLEIKVNHFKNKEFPFIIGATPTVGNYILPEYMQYFQSLSNKDINLHIDNNYILFDLIRNGELDLAFTTKKIDDSTLSFLKWKDDELTVFSNKPLPSSLDFNSLKEYKFVCRQNNSSTREALKELFTNTGYDCKDLNILSIFNNSTALKNMVLQSNTQLVSIISKSVIKSELNLKRLFSTKVKNLNLKRAIYIVYSKNMEEEKELNSIISYLKSIL